MSGGSDNILILWILIASSWRWCTKLYLHLYLASFPNAPLIFFNNSAIKSSETVKWANDQISIQLHQIYFPEHSISSAGRYTLVDPEINLMYSIIIYQKETEYNGKYKNAWPDVRTNIVSWNFYCGSLPTVYVCVQWV